MSREREPRGQMVEGVTALTREVLSLPEEEVGSTGEEGISAKGQNASQALEGLKPSPLRGVESTTYTNTCLLVTRYPSLPPGGKDMPQ